MQVTDEMVAKAVEAWNHDWRSGPPEQNETSAMRAALTAALAKAWRPIAWTHEDDLPPGYPYDKMFVYSEVRGGVRMFPVYCPPPLPEPPATKEAGER